MHRVCVTTAIGLATILTLPPSVSHHVVTVLRLRPGDEISVFDGTGRECCLRLTSVSAASVQGEVMAFLPEKPQLTPLILGQALPKNPKMDLIVEKCSELGLTTLVPLYTERTVVRKITDRTNDKLVRWQRIAEAAARQCGRQTIMEIRSSMSFADFCADYATAPGKILCWEEEQQQGIRQALATFTGHWPLVVVIGPEGGFSAPEVALARAHNFMVANLGPLTLRTETAAIVATALVRYSLYELEPQREYP